MELDPIDPDFQRVNDDHQALARQVDTIHRLASTAAPERKGFVEALNRLADLSSAHFAHEEAYMASRAYGALEPHKLDHEDLLHTLGTLIAACAEGELAISPDIAIHLRNWLNLHIARYDEPFHQFATLG